MRRPNSKPVDKRMFQCPQCKKMRLARPFDHVVNFETREYKTKDGDQITLFMDICDYCQVKNFRKYFEPTKADLRRVLKAMHEDKKLPEEQSIEDLL